MKARFDWRRWRVLLALTPPLLAACGGADPQPSSVTLVFRMRNQPATEEFRYLTTAPELIARAREQMSLPADKRTLFAAGSIAAGNGGHNQPWSWHFTSLTLTQVSIELCDGRPSMVEAGLDYWLNTVKSFCPWGSYLHAVQP